VLVISNAVLRNDNGFGNTFANIFRDIPGVELASIYCRSGVPEPGICNRYFKITPSMLLRNLINKNNKAGEEVAPRTFTRDDCVVQNKCVTRSLVWFARTRRWQVFFWLRELIWKLGCWKCPELDKFIRDAEPDLIFLPLYDCYYTNDIGLYVKERTGAEIVLYAPDDVYSLKQWSLSPLYWIDRFVKRRKVRLVAAKARMLYVISRQQQVEYQDIFELPCKILFKCGDFLGEPPVKQWIGHPMKFVFTGNIGAGRWKSLAKIGDALRTLNQNGIRAQLEIYTLTPLTRIMRRKLDDGRNVFLKGSLDARDVAPVQRDADILVHVESFERKHVLATRLSFSTKIVDYLQQARCILAVGSRECASIDYIERNSAGVVATSQSEVYENVKMLVDNPALVREYGHNAYACGRRHHQREEIKGMLSADLFSIINQN